MTERGGRIVPGEVLVGEEPIRANVGRRTATVEVTNTSVWPVHVGSHFHFFEVNRRLRFDRAAAFGMRLDIPSGTAVRFEPGDSRDVALVALGGTRRSVGFNGLVDGSVAGGAERALLRARERGFLSEEIARDTD